jgi:hypothetical protein
MNQSRYFFALSNITVSSQTAEDCSASAWLRAERESGGSRENLFEHHGGLQHSFRPLS